MKAFPFFKPSNQVEHAVPLNKNNVYKNCEDWCYCNLRMV